MPRLVSVSALLGLLLVGVYCLWPGRDYGGLRASAVAAENDMKVERLGSLLVKEFGETRVASKRPGTWVITLVEEQKEDDGNDDAEEEAVGAVGAGGRVLLVMTDARANRMRIMAPVTEIDLQDEGDLKLVLLAMHANYDRALDARYALQDGVLWSAFIHPLSSLTEDDLKSGLSQVETLRENTGTSFSSGGLLFAPGGVQEQPPKESAKDEPTI